MSTEKSEGESNNYIFLNKKREKKKHKKHKYKKQSEEEKQKKLLISHTKKKKRDMKLTKERIRYFFLINWESKIYYKESIKIGEYINGLIYWFIINSSYFIEENIEDYPKILKEKYLVDNNTNNDLHVISGDSENSKNILDSNKENINFSLNNDNSENNLNIKNELNDEDYKDKDNKEKNDKNLLEYNSENSSINSLKETILKQLDLINEINKKNINKLEEKSKQLKDEYDSNNKNINNENNNYIKYINENPIYTKNDLSLSIKNKFLTYLYNKERDDLLKKGQTQRKNINNNDENEDEEDDKSLNTCFICNNCDINQYEMLYECEQCNIVVHPYCYGIKPTKSPKHWKCDKCKKMSLDEANKLECILCPNKGGALKKMNIPIDSNFYQNLMGYRNSKKELPKENYNIIIPKKPFNEIECAWVHLSCALWNKNISIGNIDLKKNITIIDQNNFEKFNSLCNICNKSNYGPTIKCNNNNCTFQFHPECARLNDNYLEVEYVDGDLKYNIYCHKHHPNKYAKIRNNIAKYNMEEIYEFDDALKKVYKLYKKHYDKEIYTKNKNGNENSIIEIPININDIINIEKKIKKEKNKKYIKVSNFLTKEQKKIKRYHNKKYKDKSTYLILNLSDDENDDVNKNRLLIKNNEDKNNKILINKENNGNKFILKINDICKYSQNENDESFENNNNKYPTILIKDITFNENKSNNNDDENNLTEKNTEINKTEKLISLEEEIKKNKDSFILYLTEFLYNYFKKNRIILVKEAVGYSFPEDEDEENNYIYEMNYEDLFNGQIPLNQIKYNNLPFEIIKKYLEYIFPDEESFNNLFIAQLDSLLKKYKETKIIIESTSY